MIKTSNKLPRPSSEQVNHWLKKWKKLAGYVPQEKSLNKLFLKTYPFNNEIDDVLIKVCALNQFYSTNIRKIFDIADHIVSLNIDVDLKNNKLDLVEKIASGHGIRKKKKDGTEGKEINYYSFATKYCSHHKSDIYPIYDSFVEKMLLNFKNEFGDFPRQDIRSFKKFRNTLIKFKEFYGLDFSLKDIDKYLWQAGKKYFPKKYS